MAIAADTLPESISIWASRTVSVLVGCCIIVFLSVLTESTGFRKMTTAIQTENLALRGLQTQVRRVHHYRQTYSQKAYHISLRKLFGNTSYYLAASQAEVS